MHDPMCSWCWAFNPAFDSLLGSLPGDVDVHRVLGGLAPDADELMPLAMQQMLQRTWLTIQAAVPGTEFNFDFWTDNQPRRSTWPACRAVLAAIRQDNSLEVPMIRAIQHAYYLHAENPSDTDVLVSLATGIGCDSHLFAEYLHSPAAHEELARQRRLTQALGIQGFPGLVFLDAHENLHPIAVDYHAPARMLEQIEQANVA